MPLYGSLYGPYLGGRPDGRGRSDAGVMKAEGKAGQGCSAPILINVALIAMMMAVRFF